MGEWAEYLKSGKFSVSASKTVQFSQGNLQYCASSRTWGTVTGGGRYAENSSVTLTATPTSGCCAGGYY